MNVSIEEIKEFAIWCRTQNIESFTIGNLSVKFWPVAQSVHIEPVKEPSPDELQKEFEEVLYHSAP